MLPSCRRDDSGSRYVAGLPIREIDLTGIDCAVVKRAPSVHAVPFVHRSMNADASSFTADYDPTGKGNGPPAMPAFRLSIVISIIR